MRYPSPTVRRISHCSKEKCSAVPVRPWSSSQRTIQPLRIVFRIPGYLVRALLVEDGDDGCGDAEG